MAGAVQVWKSVGYLGRSSYNTDGTVVVMDSDTSNTNPGLAPISIPTTPNDTSYSMETWIYLKVSKAPDNAIKNVRFWSHPNRQDDYVVLWVGTSYYHSAGAAHFAGSPKNSISSAAVVNGDSARAYDAPGNYLFWDDYTKTGHSMSQISSTSAHLVLQYQVGSQAALGSLFNENCVMHFSYDEN